MDCYYHPQVDAVTTCRICGQPICKHCSIKMKNGNTWCYSCLKKSEENDRKWLKNFRVRAIIGGILWVLVLSLNIKEYGTGGIIQGLIIGFLIACLPITHLYSFNALKAPEHAKTSIIIKFIVMFLMGPFVLIKAIKYYKYLEEGLKSNKEIEDEEIEIYTKDFCDFFNSDFIYFEDALKKLEKKYNLEDMISLKENFIYLKDATENKKMKREGEYGKIKDEVIKDYEEKLEKVEERIKKLDEKYPSKITAHDKLPFQKVKKISQENDKKIREKSKKEEEYIEEKCNVYIETLLDIENQIKSLEENYNIEDTKKIKKDLELKISWIGWEKTKIEQDYGKIDDEILEVFDERLKRVEERIKKLESKY